MSGTMSPHTPVPNLCYAILSKLSKRCVIRCIGLILIIKAGKFLEGFLQKFLRLFIRHRYRSAEFRRNWKTLGYVKEKIM